MTCDKRKVRKPWLCDGEIISLACGCGKVFSRCIGHEGMIGARRSHSCHRTISTNLACHYAPTPVREPAPPVHQTKGREQ